MAGQCRPAKDHGMWPGEACRLRRLGRRAFAPPCFQFASPAKLESAIAQRVLRSRCFPAAIASLYASVLAPSAHGAARLWVPHAFAKATPWFIQHFRWRKWARQEPCYGRHAPSITAAPPVHAALPRAGADVSAQKPQVMCSTHANRSFKSSRHVFFDSARPCHAGRGMMAGVLRFYTLWSCVACPAGICT